MVGKGGKTSSYECMELYLYSYTLLRGRNIFSCYVTLFMSRGFLKAYVKMYLMQGKAIPVRPSYVLKFPGVSNY
jgi:hypothetical protein